LPYRKGNNVTPILEKEEILKAKLGRKRKNINFAPPSGGW
jgi:hypothetical protein